MSELGGESQPDNAQAIPGMGTKRIGWFSSVAILLNNILGPGIANFSALYQQAGWLVPTALTTFCIVCSLLSSEMLLVAMRVVPGNLHLEKRVEFCTLCRHFFPRPSYVFFAVLFQLSMFATNLSNIVQTAQIFDYIVDDMFGDSCALMFYPHPFHFFCHTNPSNITPFDGGIVLSIGILVVAVFSIPLGYWNLDDNAFVQNVCLVVIVASIGVWALIFCVVGLEVERTPLIGDNFREVGGTVMFNFMFISTLPSWVCEKHPSVSSLQAVSITLGAAMLAYLSVGLLGAMAFAPFYETDNTIMSKLNGLSHTVPRGWRVTAKLAVDAYAVAANLASIPIFSIMMRYNLIDSGVLGRSGATVASVLLPWVASVLLYTGQGFKNVVDFTGTFTSSIVNLIAPALLFLFSQRRLAKDAARQLGGTRTLDHAAGDRRHGEALISINTACAAQSAALDADYRSVTKGPAWCLSGWAIVISMSLLTLASIAAQGIYT